MQRSSLLLLLFFFCTLGLLRSQDADSGNLLHQADKEAYTNPLQALRVVDFALSKGPAASDHDEVWLIAAKAHSAMGRRDKSIKAGFQSLNFVINSNEIASNQAAEVFLACAFYEIGLAGASSFLPCFHKGKDISSQPLEAQIVHALIESNKSLESGEHNLALMSLRQAIKLKERHASSELNVPLDPHLVLSAYYLERYQADSALYYINKVAEASTSLPEGHLILARIAIQKAEVQFLKERYSDAISTLNACLRTALNLQNTELQHTIYNLLAQNHIALGNLEAYVSNLDKASSIEPQLEMIRNEALNEVHTGFQNLQNTNFESQQAHWLRQRQNLMVALMAIVGVALIFSLINQLRISKKKGLLQFAEVNTQISKKEVEQSKRAVLPQKQLTIHEDTEQAILEKLVQFEKGKRFLKKDMSLAQLSSHLGTNTKYLSEIINRHKGKNFNLYINELRVEYIIQKLRSDSTYLNYKVSYLADESGFASHSSFTTVFKSITGISPARYIALLRKEE